MTDRELMQQALDLLDDINQCSLPPTGIPLPAEIDHVMEALRARLAQPEEPDWSAAGFSKPPTHSEAWWKHEVSNAWAGGYEKGRASVKQPEQEPVAWADKYDLDREGHDFWVSRQQPAKNGVPLYTAPPQRDETPAKAVEWQGLTMEEMDALVEEQSGWPVEMVGHVLICAAEAKLREKNT